MIRSKKKLKALGQPAKKNLTKKTGANQKK